MACTAFHAPLAITPHHAPPPRALRSLRRRLRVAVPRALPARPTAWAASRAAPSAASAAAAADGRVELDPPNGEVDWVVVDVRRAEDIASDDDGEDLSGLEDDAKSLVRVALRDAAVEMSVLLCSDARIRQLNAQYRGKDAATDVLSFPQNDPDGVILGDIIVSVDTAAAQAAERGLQLRDEIRVLLVHGLLHLLGYDHEGETDGDWLVMAQMENRLLRELGWKGEGLVSVTLQGPYRDIVQPP